jgi:hypothetical protein
MKNVKNWKIKSTIGYTRKQANKEWLDKECAKVNEEKNAARKRCIQNNTRRGQECLQTNPDEKEVLV